MTFYIGVTDLNWYNFLSQKPREDINFWQPGGKTNFRVLNTGGAFLFKLKAPVNAIAGIGFFSTHSILPLSVAWEAFGERNGCATFEEFEKKISSYRKDKSVNPEIGCIVLTSPIFWQKEDWIQTPANWANSLVVGKSYSTIDDIGKKIWLQVQDRIDKYANHLAAPKVGEEIFLSEGEVKYGVQY